MSLLSPFTASLALRPFRDEAVGDGLFWGKPEGGGVASSGWSLHLQGGGDFIQTEPASVLQLRVVNVQLDNRKHSRSHDTSLSTAGDATCWPAATRSVLSSLFSQEF